MGYTEVVQMTVPFTSNTTDFSVSITTTTHSADTTTTTTYL